MRDQPRFLCLADAVNDCIVAMATGRSVELLAGRMDETEPRGDGLRPAPPWLRFKSCARPLEPFDISDQFVEFRPGIRRLRSPDDAVDVTDATRLDGVPRLH